MPSERRAAMIIEEASCLFAERGWDAPTRDLARRLGVTQALLYKYFPSKEALIEAVFEMRAARREEACRTDLLADRSRPLEERLVAFYRHYLTHVDPAGMRLFLRGALDGYQVARRYSAPLTDRILAPIAAELRMAAGVPGFERREMLRGEREIAMMLHGGIMFLAIRKHVYDMPMPEALGDLVALQVRTFLPGAIAEVARLHREPGHDTLKIRQLGPGRRR